MSDRKEKVMELARRRRGSVPKVHTRGEARLDAMLELAEEASRPAPLPEVLQSLCSRISQVLAVDVCSIYLRELVDAPANRRSAGDLVLSATSGYSHDAVGRVRMRVGEGLTGFAVECLRPVSVARVSTDARNKAFPDLDEERFPSFCAVPLVDGGRAVGALVVQRRQPHAFGQREIVLIASMAPPVLFALERARLRERERMIELPPPAPHDRVHEVTLRGQAASPGEALGTIAVRRHHHAPRKPPRPSPSPDGARKGESETPAPSPADERARLGTALAEAASEMAELVAWALKHAPEDDRAASGFWRSTMQSLVSPARFVLDDARLRGRMRDEIESGATAEAAVERVMREYARVLSSAEEGVLRDRALEVEALCLRVLNKLGAPSSKLPPGAILAAARMTICDAIELRAAHGSGAVLSGPASASPGLAVAVALGLPVVSGVTELFRWVADGDRALLDGAAGTMIVNPSRVDVAAHRKR
jgi:phosphotransferase system enzyme I (PtsP)